MEPGMGRLGMEAEDIAIGEVIGDCLQTSFEALAVVEFEILAAREARDGLGNVAMQSISDDDGGHLAKSQRWCKLGKTVICLHSFAVRGIGVGHRVISHTAVRWVGITMASRQFPIGVVLGFGFSG